MVFSGVSRCIEWFGSCFLVEFKPNRYLLVVFIPNLFFWGKTPTTVNIPNEAFKLELQ